MPAVASAKPLGRKAYGSIGHLPGSRISPGDHHIHDGQARILTEKCRKGDTIIVQEKLDGSCVAVAKVDGEIIAIGRAGYLADTSPHLQHKVFAHWVRKNRDRFDSYLAEGERFVGEWLAQAHGTQYSLTHEPFVVFDLMVGTRRATFAELDSRIGPHDAGLCAFVRPQTLWYGVLPVTVPEALRVLGGRGHHGAQDQPEGVVYRCERDGEVEFLAKFVRSDFTPGRYLPGVDGNTEPEMWNVPLSTLWT